MFDPLRKGFALPETGCLLRVKIGFGIAECGCSVFDELLGNLGYARSYLPSHGAAIRAYNENAQCDIETTSELSSKSRSASPVCAGFGAQVTGML
jgi:hypothetical protein